MIDINNCIIIDYDYELLLDLNKFRSGNQYLDYFLYNESLVDSPVYGKTRMLYERASNDIIGYYTICASAISLNKSELDDFEENSLIKYAGAIGLTCFALNEKYRGTYASDGVDELKTSVFMLNEAFEDIKVVAEALNTKYVILSSTNEGRSLYFDYGFEFLNYEHKNLYLSHKCQCISPPTKEEIKRKDLFTFNITSEEVGCYPMMMNL